MDTLLTMCFVLPLILIVLAKAADCSTRPGRNSHIVSQKPWFDKLHFITFMQRETPRRFQANLSVLTPLPGENREAVELFFPHWRA